MKARFKTSGSQAQMRQAAEFKMVPLFEYLKLKEMITHQRNQIEELASRFVMMGGGDSWYRVHIPMNEVRHYYRFELYKFSEKISKRYAVDFGDFFWSRYCFTRSTYKT